MNILITGGSGFLGNALTDELLKNTNNHIFWISRKAFTPNKKVTVLTYDELNDELKIDIVINLAGAGIADKRWSNARKQELLDSRLIPTQKLLDFIKNTHYKPKLLISGSAIGFYGIQALNDTAIFTENEKIVRGEPVEPLNDFPILRQAQDERKIVDFSSQLCTNWENLANACDIKTAIIRTGVVLDKTGKGMLKKILPQFNFGLGGKLGNGQQAISWISIDDWVQAVLFIINKNLTDEFAYRQIYNLIAPNSINNQEFTKALGKFLKRPTVFVVPAFILRLMLGEMATLLLDGQRVYPKALLEMGFEFEYNNIDEYLTTS